MLSGFMTKGEASSRISEAEMFSLISSAESHPFSLGKSGKKK